MNPIYSKIISICNQYWIILHFFGTRSSKSSMCIYILNLLHILILTHFKFLLTSQPSNGSCIGPIANQYLVAWGIWYTGIWWQCRETDFTLSCNKHYLHLLTLCKVTRRAMAQVPETSTRGVNQAEKLDSQ